MALMVKISATAFEHPRQCLDNCHIATIAVMLLLSVFAFPA